MKKICFIAQFPPPIHGLSKAVETLYTSALQSKYLFQQINLTNNKEILKTLWKIVTNTSDLYYLTIAQTRGGNWRDLLILKLLQWKKRKCLIHLHGGYYRILIEKDCGQLQRSLNYKAISRISGTIVLGNKYSRIFTALSEHYTLTDFDLHIEDSSKSFKDMETVKALNIELIKAGMSDPDMAVSIATANSMSELKRYVAKATAVKKEENNSVSQLQQQLQQYEQNLQQLQKQNEQLQRELGQSQNQLEQNSQARLQLEAEKVAIERERVKNDKDYNDKLIETKQQQVQIQAAETVDTNPYNDKIKQVV